MASKENTILDILGITNRTSLQSDNRSLTKLLRTDRGLLYVMAGHVGSGVLLGIFWLVLANLLSVENYGQISYFVAIGATLAVLSSLGLETALTTFVAKGEKDFALHANSLALLLGVVSGGLVSLIDPVLGFFVAAVIFFNMRVSYLLGKRRYRAYSGIMLGARVLQIVLGVSLFFVLGFGGILIGYAFAILLFGLGFFSTLRGSRLQFGAVFDHRNFVIHSYGTSIIRVSSVYLDKIVIGTIFGFGVLGIYMIGSQFLLLFATLPGAVFQYLLPQKSAGFSSGNIKKISLIGSLVLSGIGFLAVPIAIRTLFPDYSDSILLAQIMMLALIPNTFTAITRAELFASERTGLALRGMSIFIVTLVLAQIALGSYVGSIGLAFAVVMGFTFEAIYLWRQVPRN